MMMNICGKNGRPFTRLWSCTLIMCKRDLIWSINLPRKKNSVYFTCHILKELRRLWNGIPVYFTINKGYILYTFVFSLPFIFWKISRCTGCKLEIRNILLLLWVLLQLLLLYLFLLPWRISYVSMHSLYPKFETVCQKYVHFPCF